MNKNKTHHHPIANHSLQGVYQVLCHKCWLADILEERNWSTRKDVTILDKPIFQTNDVYDQVLGQIQQVASGVRGEELTAVLNINSRIAAKAIGRFASRL